VALNPEQLAELQRLKQLYAPIVEAQRRRDQADANAQKMNIPLVPGKTHGGITHKSDGGNMNQEFPTVEEMRAELKKSHGMPEQQAKKNLNFSTDFSQGYPLHSVSNGDTEAYFNDGRTGDYVDDPDFRLSIKGRYANFDDSGNLISHGKDIFCRPTSEELERLKNLARATAQHLKTTGSGENVFIRFGRLPKGGVSKNHATGKLENGLSVFPSTYNRLTGEYMFDEGAGINSDAHMSYVLRGVNPYAVTGDVVGRGSDGEPVLANVKKLGTFVKSENGYVLPRKKGKGNIEHKAHGGITHAHHLEIEECPL
jgi:hypothetical protein